MLSIIRKFFSKAAKATAGVIIPPKLVSATYDKGTEIMTITYDDGSTSRYKGDCTVWSTYPMMKRLGTFGDSHMYEIWAYIKEHGNPYPTAHKKKELEENKDKFGL